MSSNSTVNQKNEADSSTNELAAPVLRIHPPQVTGMFGKRAAPVRCLRDAQRLAGKLIRAFQLRQIGSDESKTLMYLLSQYVQITKTADLDDRLSRLEEVINGH